MATESAHWVLVHGGGFAASCWDPLVPELGGHVRAVDLPGRGARPVPLEGLRIADFADAVVDEIGDLDDVVLVGHSLAGITLPAVAARIPERLRCLVFVSCAIPSDGVAVADELATFGPAAAEVAARLGSDLVSADGRLHLDLARAMFCNDMDDEQAAATLERMVPESMSVVTEPVDLAGLATGVPCTYVRLLRDASLALRTQDAALGRLPDPDVADLDAAHMAMISRPRELAALLRSLPQVVGG